MIANLYTRSSKYDESSSLDFVTIGDNWKRMLDNTTNLNILISQIWVVKQLLDGKSRPTIRKWQK